MKVNIQAMNTQEGNTLVQRIVNAAAKMKVELGATEQECIQFITKNLAVLADSEQFDEANDYMARSDAFYEYGVAVGSNAAIAL